MQKKGGRQRRQRGFQKERELVRKLWSLGFATMRAPASGAKARRTYQPDIIAVRNDNILVIEAKTRRSESTIYVGSEQIEKVKEWTRRAGEKALGLIAVYIGRKYGWRFIPIEKCGYTEKGNLRIRVEDVKSAFTLEDLKRITEKNIRRIDSYIGKKQAHS